jgi:hypothetical protein
MNAEEKVTSGILSQQQSLSMKSPTRGAPEAALQ